MTNISKDIEALKKEMTDWRHHIHTYPETAFEEQKTTQYIIEQLKSFGIDELYTEFAPTGVVGIIKGKKEGKWVGLRADIDALDVIEKNDINYCSKIPGKMHACGHDGHTAMLLGAAKYLAQHRDFAGTVVVIFQPAEENEGGGRVMVENGLFKRFPIESVFGMHNQPNMPLGHFLICQGPIMAAYDTFEIKLTGLGAHAAAPHLGKDTIVLASHIAIALQTIASRNANPFDSLVVSITQIHSGDTWNVLPQEAVIRGTVRSFKKDVQDMAEKRINEISQGLAATFNAKAEVRYERRYPATINHKVETDVAIEVASKIVGAENVVTDVEPSMGAEDFAFMLQEKPGAYIWLGAGPGANLHNPAYNFNDEVLTTGAAYYVGIVNAQLGK
ncbi:M20 aminoacylase family protein [Zophobihabitans entericus]|uniref:Amidohydrolase n=1 Tax=Zophobihabitans entericus TaxID=1635327 RepID=A0A6G9ICF9_9GAMM|nr:M20 aminoacylase family protein [Zophobihabitans entericus]QIQ21916.1 amidohydrolase [Zophobihabitans entericus]